MTAITFIRATVTMLEPGGVTTPGTLRQGEPDAVIDRDLNDRPHIPGTSLTGSLRAEALRQTGSPATVEDWFGRVGPDADSAVASRLWVLGSRLREGADAAPQPAVVTAIDRERGAARDHTLRQAEELPAGTAFDVFLRWDGDGVEPFLTLLAGWRPLLGRGVTRGRGRCAVGDIRTGTLDLSNPSDLLAWLTANGPALVKQVAVNDVETRAGSEPVALRVPCTIRGPVHVGSGRATPDEGTTRPQVRRIARDASGPVVPGSSLKGVLRSRIEYVLRSVGGEDVACLDQRCGACWTCTVFGHGGGQDDTSLSVGLRGRIRVIDATVREPVEARRQHVAVDRFTGGAADQKLFVDEVLEAGRFDLVCEDLGLSDEQAADLGALARLALQDLADGLIGIGAGVFRGYGNVRPNLDGLPTLDDARLRLAEIVARYPRRVDA